MLRESTDIPIIVSLEGFVDSGNASEIAALQKADTAENQYSAEMLVNQEDITGVNHSSDKVITPIKVDDSGEEAVFYSDYAGLPQNVPIIVPFLRNMTELGAGGMGEVFQAEIAGLNVEVAYKEFRVCPRPGESAEESQAREALTAEIFRNEVEKTQAGNIFASGPRIFEAGRNVQGRHYVVMELFKGEDLLDITSAEFHSEHGFTSGYAPLSLDDKIVVAMGIATDLDSLHRKRMVHRDVKPANIRVTEKNAHLIDYGIAKIVGEQLSFEKPDALYGTPAYMAPEVICGLGEDDLTDQYSLGVVMYEMFTGANPLKADGFVPGQPIDAAVYRSIKQPEEIADVPSDVSDIIMKALSFDRKDRYLSCGDMVDELRAAYLLHTGEGQQSVMLSGNPQDDVPTLEIPVMLIDGNHIHNFYNQAEKPALR